MTTKHELAEPAPAETVCEGQSVSGWRDLAPRPRAGFWKALRKRRFADWPLGTLCGFLLMPLGFAMPHMIAAFIFPVFGLLYDSVRWLTGMMETGAEIKSMADLPTPPGQFPVRIFLTHKGTTYGADRGLLTVMEGGIHFTGLQTDFALSRRNAWMPSNPWGLRTHSLSVDFRIRDFDGSLGILAMGRTPAELETNARQLATILRRWNRTSPAQAWEMMVDPPTIPQPRYLGSTYAKCAAVGAVLSIGAVALLVVFAAYRAGYFYMQDFMGWFWLMVWLLGLSAALAGWLAVRSVRGLKAMEP